MQDRIEIFPWNENFATGIDSIDRQHQRLVELLNTLVGHLAFQLDAPAIEDVLAELKSYSNVHFADEESIWREHFGSDPWMEWHRNAHDDFIQKIVELKENADGRDFERVIEDIVSFLTHWLALHIIESDKRMAKVVLAMPTGVSLERAKELANKEMSGATRVLIDTVMGMYDNLAHRTILLTREINARIKTEAALRAAQESLARLKEEAEIREQRALSDIRNFADVIAHHIQESVRAQIMYTSVLKKTLAEGNPFSRDVDYAIEQVTKGAERLRLLMRDMEMHMALSGQHWTPTRCRLNDVLDTALRRLSPKIRDKAARIDAGDLPTVAVDVNRMVDVFAALIDNALSFGRPEIPPVVVVAAAVADDRLTVVIDDNGIGIPEEYRERVFRMFERLAPASHSTGTGIGLSLVKKTMDSIGGTVRLSASDAGGTRVQLSVPLPDEGRTSEAG
ncbi:MAG TPA: bacteriohemerythrin [Azospirillum sp.]|nr:bacteriohemerythrin [Azospirillum sp.]